MESMGFIEIVARAIQVLIPMVLSLTVHEYAHGFMAKRLGDDTAQSMGRLTLNPLAHADPIGTFMLPMAILILNGALAGSGMVPFFGWAKPVPFNPARFTRKINVRSGIMLVAAAGPLANLILGTLCAGLFSWAAHGGGEVFSEPILVFLRYMLSINIALFVFNMLPIYPLDGQKVVSGLLSARASITFERFNYQYGNMMLFGLILFAPRIIALPVAWVSHGVMLLVGLG